MSDTPRLKTELSDIQNIINSYKESPEQKTMFKMPNINKNIYLYIGISICMLLLLLLIRPICLYVDVKDKKIFSYRKLFLWWLILSCICILGLYGYNYKKQSS